MLEQFCYRELAPKLEVVFIDEAQDLSPLQWKMVHLLEANSKEMFVAGDDDQAIFRYAGADVDYFIGLEGGRKGLLDGVLHAHQMGGVQRRRARGFRRPEGELHPDLVVLQGPEAEGWLVRGSPKGLRRDGDLELVLQVVAVHHRGEAAQVDQLSPRDQRGGPVATRQGLLHQHQRLDEGALSARVRPVNEGDRG